MAMAMAFVLDYRQSAHPSSSAQWLYAHSFLPPERASKKGEVHTHTRARKARTRVGWAQCNISFLNVAVQENRCNVLAVMRRRGVERSLLELP
jgi:hypothetical protein